MGSEDKIRYIKPISKSEVLKKDKFEQIINMFAAAIDLGALQNEELDLIIQNGNEAVEEFTAFLKNIGKFIVDERGLGTASINERVDEEKRSVVIRIDRTESFNPAQFTQHEGLEIDEQDERSVMLEEIDLYTIALESMLIDETVIGGEEHLKRLGQTGYLRLDARIFQTLWENQYLIPEHWKGTIDVPKHIFFDGTVLRNRFGRYVICMYWAEDQKWRWTYCRVNLGGWRAEDLSAVLKV